MTVPTAACASELPASLVRAIEVYRIEEPLCAALLELGTEYAAARMELHLEFMAVADGDPGQRYLALQHELNPRDEAARRANDRAGEDRSGDGG